MIEYLASNPTTLAAICTVLGGILLKIVESWLARHVQHVNDRKDYREEIRELHERIDRLEEANTAWRKRAYTAEEQKATLRLLLIRSGLDVPQEFQ